jgi:hypothetical protein
MLFKRGQITVFVILGILVLGLIIAFFVLRDNSTLEELENNDPNVKSSPLKIFIDDCLEKKANEAVYLTALQGGYYNTPLPYENVSQIFIPLYWQNNQSYFPTKDVVEEEMFNYVKDNLPICLNDFTSFKDRGYEINVGEIKGEATISNRGVLFDVKYPLYIKNADTETNLDSFSVNIQTEYNNFYNYASLIVEEQKRTPNSLPLGFITSLASKNNFTFDAVSIDENNVVIFLKSNNQNDEFPLVYSFINKYDWSKYHSDVSEESVEPVSIEPIPPFTIDESTGTFEYQVNAKGKDITFRDNTNMFNINSKTGEIIFETYYVPKGEKYVLIEAEDSYGNKNIEYMKIIFNFDDITPVIESIGNLTAYVGEEFVYQVKASDPNDKKLMFFDNSELFDINLETGEIKFTPLSKENHTIKITVTNDKVNEYEEMRLEVK